MIGNIKTGAGVSDRSADRDQPRREDDAPDRRGPPQSQETSPDHRLVIERDAQGEYYVYKLIDRATGEVIAEHRREEVAKLADGPDYTAGKVVSTKA